MILKYLCRFLDLWWHHRWIYCTPHCMSHWPPQEKKDCSNRWFFSFFTQLLISFDELPAVMTAETPKPAYSIIFYLSAFVCPLFALWMLPEVLLIDSVWQNVSFNKKECLFYSEYILKWRERAGGKKWIQTWAQPRDLPSRNIGHKHDLPVKLLWRSWLKPQDVCQATFAVSFQLLSKQ